jgi:NAD(P)-dependent dehydrogenase (short-subunit alcohol dehydrogenase family)
MSLAQSLLNEGWNVVVLSFPQNLLLPHSSLPEGVNRVMLGNSSENHLKQQLAEISQTDGAIGTFIHLHPFMPIKPSSSLFNCDADRAIIKQVFLIAKHLKASLNQAVSATRSCFVTIASLDGAFGFGQAGNFSPIGAGLLGLTKSLNLEWPSVFCRAIDLSPELHPERSAQYILAEIHDPNLCVTEVGYGAQGQRTTLVCSEEGAK